MRCLRFAAAALVALGVQGARGQDQALFPPPDAAEEIESPRGESASEPGANLNVAESSRMLQGSGIPYSPYPAGLVYTMAPQPFRVPYPNRIYYPPSRYVRQCPYYPKGFYWGADWNHRLLACNPWLIHGDKRFNPYLTQAKREHYSGKQTRGAAPTPHFTVTPGEPIYESAPPLASAKSSRRASKITDVSEVVVSSKELPEVRDASESNSAASPKPQSSQVKFSESDESEQATKASSAPKAKPIAKTASRAGQRALPSWQRPPVRR
jgi:hypothetical protein